MLSHLSDAQLLCNADRVVGGAQYAVLSMHLPTPFGMISVAPVSCSICFLELPPRPMMNGSSCKHRHHQHRICCPNVAAVVSRWCLLLPPLLLAVLLEASTTVCFCGGNTCSGLADTTCLRVYAEVRDIAVALLADQ
jgi:hypothetical protein